MGAAAPLSPFPRLAVEACPMQSQSGTLSSAGWRGHRADQLLHGLGGSGGR